MNNTYNIPAGSFGLFQKAVERANRKAEKLGVAPLTVERLGSVKTTQPDGSISKYEKVSIKGTEISLNGWKFIGTISVLVADDGRKLPLITAVPGETVTESRYAADPLFCAHCKARRDRLETYIVRHEDGTEKQVGSSCLKDFIGDNNTSPDAVARWAGICIALDREVGGILQDRDFSGYSFQHVIATTEAVCRARGWVSKAMSGPTAPATARFVRAIMDARSELAAIDNRADFENFLTSFGLDEKMIPTRNDLDNASQIIEKLQVSLDKDEETGEVARSNYLFALRTMLMAGTVNTKAFNVAVSYKAYMLRRKMA
jgi:hypothetical protein